MLTAGSLGLQLAHIPQHSLEGPSPTGRKKLMGRDKDGPRLACLPWPAPRGNPEAGSGCPMFDLVDPISRGPWRLPRRACTMPF